MISMVISLYQSMYSLYSVHKSFYEILTYSFQVPLPDIHSNQLTSIILSDLFMSCHYYTSLQPQYLPQPPVHLSPCHTLHSHRQDVFHLLLQYKIENLQNPDPDFGPWKVFLAHVLNHYQNHWKKTHP